MPFCTAPFTSAVVDPDKGVRPCCVFDGRLGNLRETRLRDLLEGEAWQEMQEQVARGDMPPGCGKCYQREKATGWSVRHSFMQARATLNGEWRKGITELELNSSSVCNLACTHCNVDFSSRWAHLVAQLDERKVPHYRISHQQVFNSDPEAMVRHLSELDLGHLEQIRFKGGEPMLNADVPAVLRYLHGRGMLQRMRVFMVTNGSLVNEEVLGLLAHASKVDISISVDGVGKAQEYIRHGPSGTPRLEESIATLATLPRIEMNTCVSIMAYNVFTLDRITRWWDSLRRRHGAKLRHPIAFQLEVIEPPILAVNVLQDATRKRLIRKYRWRWDADYSSVVQALRQPFAGTKLHNEFVEYTRGMDAVRKTDWRDAVPELEAEMVELAPPGPPAPARARQLLVDARQRARAGMSHARARARTIFAPSDAGEALRKGASWSRRGRYRRTVRLYDRYLRRQPAVAAAEAWPIRLHRALLLAKLGEWERCLDAFDGLVRIDPRRTLASLERAGSPFMAVALDAQPAEADALGEPRFRLLVEGLAYRALDDASAAAARWDRALALDPGFVLARVAREGLSVAPPTPSASS
jgi:MoaA/NifB/PqqE/SkfB family radical SAM enzyme/tetratricopeptide (TPR) repeat protein